MITAHPPNEKLLSTFRAFKLTSIFSNMRSFMFLKNILTGKAKFTVLDSTTEIVSVLARLNYNKL